MKSIDVHSLPINEVIQNIATGLRCDFVENCDEYLIELPENIGKGSIRGISFNDGLGLIIYNCSFYEDLEIRFVKDDVHPLKFIYCVDGSLIHRFAHENINHEIEKYQHVIVANKDNAGHIIKFYKNEQTTMTSVEIIRNQFQGEINCELEKSDKKLIELFRDQTGKTLFYHEGFYSLKLADIFKGIEEHTDQKLIRKLFLKSKTYSILVEQIMLYRDDILDESNRTILRRQEIDQIETAKKIIYTELENLPSIENIANRIGIPVAKLQLGFKDMYNVTVNEFVHKTRLQVATIMLADKDKTLAEIQDNIGISSKSYFSKIIREEYHMTPSEFRKQNMEVIKSKKKPG
ncbi:helix-turn-helix transcriptional regulator [Galbibacter sp. BG1]|uniref:helix-turn-helix transcriptional regulator n=1 Tax=Galbibacter sp. BG1 TaxID=1170699 RepID=UPI0015BDEBB0|nr:helix-turn-helix transcriptional regulator [Galbibacter sp. BG1]QLE02838.1 helix-turn-helix transcriptional regulator [Galbibacter sp. BG1]